MAQTRRFKIIIWALLGFILLATAATVVYFVKESYGDVSLQQRALAAYAANDFVTARKLLLELVLKDENNEDGIVKLATIEEATGHWTDAIYFRNKAARLNSLNESYKEAYVNAMLMGRAHSRLAKYYTELRKGALTQEDEILRIYALLITGNERDGVKAWKDLVAVSSEVEKTSWGKLIRVAFFSSEETIENVLNTLETLATDPYLPICQEALLARASVEQRLKRPEEEEKALKALCKINPCLGTPRLADFLCRSSRFPEAIDILDKYLPEFFNSKIAMFQGEFMLFAGQPEKLTALAQLVKSHSSRHALQAAHYIDALIAFDKQDYEALVESFRPIKKEVETPLARLLGLLVDIKLNDAITLETDYRKFLSSADFRDFRNRALVIVTQFIIERLKTGDSLESLTRLIELAEASAGHEIEGNPTLIRLALLEKLANSSITELELQEIMKASSSAPDVMEIAVGYYYSHGDIPHAQALLDKLDAIKDSYTISRFTRRMKVNLLLHNGELDKASEEFHTLLINNPEMEDAASYWMFAVSHQRKSDLALLRELSEKDAKLADYYGFCNLALRMLEEGETMTPKTISDLKALDTKLDNLKEFAAYELVSVNEFDEAVKRYEAISPEYQDYNRILSNLANLYVKIGKNDLAKQRIQAALKMSPDNFNDLTLYSTLLREENDWQTLLTEIKEGKWGEEQNGEMFANWLWAMEQSLTDQLAKKRYLEARSVCQRIQLHDPDNAIAQQALATIAEATKRKVEKADGSKTAAPQNN